MTWVNVKHFFSTTLKKPTFANDNFLEINVNKSTGTNKEKNTFQLWALMHLQKLLTSDFNSPTHEYNNTWLAQQKSMKKKQLFGSKHLISKPTNTASNINAQNN